MFSDFQYCAWYLFLSKMFFSLVNKGFSSSVLLYKTLWKSCGLWSTSLYLESPSHTLTFQLRQVLTRTRTTATSWLSAFIGFVQSLMILLFFTHAVSDRTILRPLWYLVTLDCRWFSLSSWGAPKGTSKNSCPKSMNTSWNADFQPDRRAFMKISLLNQGKMFAVFWCISSVWQYMGW